MTPARHGTRLSVGLRRLYRGGMSLRTFPLCARNPLFAVFVGGYTMAVMQPGCIPSSVSTVGVPLDPNPSPSAPPGAPGLTPHEIQVIGTWFGDVVGWWVILSLVLIALIVSLVVFMATRGD